MSIAIGEDHLALLAVARRFTAERCPPAVARAALDAAEAGEEALPPFWDQLARLGWLGLAVPEAAGGEGAGYGALAVVLEELARAAAPGPLLPTAWAASLLGATPGPTVGAVALQAAIEARDAGDGGLFLRGGTGPLPGGAGAGAVVVPVMVAGEERWAVVEHGEDAVGAVTVTRLAALDPTCGLARLDLVEARARLLPGVDRQRVEAVGVVLAAAECAGGATWCVDTAAAYARDRRQFGRPIGQFQAVKHRCADMLVRLEQIRALAWDAAAALDGPEAGLAVAAAGAVVFDAFAAVAKDCIQVLGGIGFTWEHDAHLYLRRALALRQLFGTRAWRAAAAGGR